VAPSRDRIDADDVRPQSAAQGVDDEFCHGVPSANRRALAGARDGSIPDGAVRTPSDAGLAVPRMKNGPLLAVLLGGWTGGRALRHDHRSRMRAALRLRDAASKTSRT
jgi:hypothetical protein